MLVVISSVVVGPELVVVELVVVAVMVMVTEFVVRLVVLVVGGWEEDVVWVVWELVDKVVVPDPVVRTIVDRVVGPDPVGFGVEPVDVSVVRVEVGDGDDVDSVEPGPAVVIKVGDSGFVADPGVTVPVPQATTRATTVVSLHKPRNIDRPPFGVN